jgi:hypothetical protein
MLVCMALNKKWKVIMSRKMCCEKVGNTRDYFSLIVSLVKIQIRDLLNPKQEG